MITFDTETCGFVGPVILVQYAEDDGPIYIHDVWHRPVRETLTLTEKLVDSTVVGFNLAFDWFHICKTYNTLRLLDLDKPPTIEGYVSKELDARFGPCLKPANALDLLLHARKGPYQSTMNRKPVKIRNVPAILAKELVKELNKRISLPDILFAKRRSGTRWKIHDTKRPAFKDVVLDFAPSAKLKVLVRDALKDKNPRLFEEVQLPKYLFPVEFPYAPFALCVGTPNDWKGAWPSKIQYHIDHWSTNSEARQYAEDDVYYTRELYRYFGCPSPGDNDSILACMVGAVRLRGFKIDEQQILKLRDEKIQALQSIPINYNSSDQVAVYLRQVMSPEEALVIKDSRGKRVLAEIEKWKKDQVCDECNGAGCSKCVDGIISSGDPHPAALRAGEVLSARFAKKEIEIYNKLLRAGRFHASLNVIGAKSSRMSGTDKLNAQGINRDKKVRACFPLADPETHTLCGGDAESFEVVLMDAYFEDPLLRQQLQTKHTCHQCKGTLKYINKKGELADCDNCKDGEEYTKIHALFGTFFFPPNTYEQIYNTKGLQGDNDLYARSKSGVFAIFYKGNAATVHRKVGIEEENAQRAFDKLYTTYKVWAEKSRKLDAGFCSMTQPGGIGTKVIWKEPKEYIESMFGFRRYFTYENQICKALYELANSLPEHWKSYTQFVQRRDRVQKAYNAVQTAINAAAFGLQGSNLRAAGNHIIQSSGGELIKRLQRLLWDKMQPQGITEFVILPLNVHDELMVPTLKGHENRTREIVEKFVQDTRERVPLFSMTWDLGMKNWSEK